MPSEVNWPLVARLLLTSRAIDRIEETELAPAGKVVYQFSARGHDLAQILLALHLTHKHDAAAVYYRSRPFMLAAGLTAQEALAADMAKAGSPSEGRDVGVIFSMPPRNGVTVLPSSGDVGAQYTPAAGWAHAITYRRNVLNEEDWEGAASVALGGDGSTAASGFWSALNTVTTLKLPLLFFVEDNSYAISVPSLLQTPGTNIAANLSGFANLTVVQADGSNPADTAAKITEAVHLVRSRFGPVLLRVRVPRLAGHSIVDNQAYKPPEVRADEEARDPLPHLRKFLSAKRILSVKAWEELEGEVNAKIAAARDAALAQADPDPATAARHVFFEGLPQRVGGLLPEGVSLSAPLVTRHSPPAEGPRINMLDAIRRTLESELAANPRVLVFGEDVGVKGGVHGATLDLQSKFSCERVFDTSLSEEGIIGTAVGMALAGLLPIPEIQFRKYADPATEQINDCGWMRWRTAGKFGAPMVVRIPVGYGKKTGDPWHSVSGEAVYAHSPGWRLAFPSNAEDAVGLLRESLRGNDPTIFFEHRALLDTPPARRPYPGDDFVLPFGAAARLTTGGELTVVTWGEMVYRCLSAAEPFAGRIEILDLRTIVPWDREAVISSVRQTGKCLIVHEDTLTAGFGAEIAATVSQDAFTALDAPIERLATADCPIPYNSGLMTALVPSIEAIGARIQELLAF
ncbi:MAG: pyruvate dehydrogenase [Chloroflexi bacterium]|nr:pyruvate dehydrogenase [Chloroflexota bacterium]